MTRAEKHPCFVKIICRKNSNFDLTLRKRLFCKVKQPLLPCKTYAFTMQKNRFCKVLITKRLRDRCVGEKCLHVYRLSKKAKQLNCYLAFCCVGILGLEPRITGPESVVLPLHHIPICLHLFPICGCKVTTFLVKCKNYPNFFSNSCFLRV